MNPFVKYFTVLCIFFSSFGYGDVTIRLVGYPHPITVPTTAAQETECAKYVTFISDGLYKTLDIERVVRSQWLKYRIGFPQGEDTMGAIYVECIEKGTDKIKCDAASKLVNTCFAADILLFNVKSLEAYIRSLNEKNTDCTSLPHVFCTSVLGATPDPSPSQSCGVALDLVKKNHGFTSNAAHDEYLVSSCPARLPVPEETTTSQPSTTKPSATSDDERTTTGKSTITGKPTTTVKPTTTGNPTITRNPTTTTTRKAPSSGSNRLVVTVALIGGLASMLF